MYHRGSLPSALPRYASLRDQAQKKGTLTRSLNRMTGTEGVIGVHSVPQSQHTFLTVGAPHSNLPCHPALEAGTRQRGRYQLCSIRQLHQEMKALPPVFAKQPTRSFGCGVNMEGEWFLKLGLRQLSARAQPSTLNLKGLIITHFTTCIINSRMYIWGERASSVWLSKYLIMLAPRCWEV